MVSVKTFAEIKILEEGGKILASVLNIVSEMVKPGVATAGLDSRARDLIKKAGGQPSFLDYKPRGSGRAYPASLCVSINDEIVHGVPSDRILLEGDVVGLDLGLEYKKLFTDMAVTVGVGNISEENKKLIEITKEALAVGIKEIKAGARVGDYGFAVQKFAKEKGLAVVRDLVGHGVGYAPHEDPDIPNWGIKGRGLELKAGMVLALEPMLCSGNGEIKLGRDGWVWKTKNGSNVAHFEHTVVVEKGGCRILTKI